MAFCLGYFMKREDKTMRKYSLGLLWMMLWITYTSVSAQTISKDEAARIAAKYIDRVPVERSTRGYKTEQDTRTGTANTPYYIFNDADGEGFVIVSGCEETHEVVGYAIGGHIDASNMPPALAAYLEDYSKTVKILTQQSKHSSQTRAGGKKSQSKSIPTVISRITEPVAPLLKTKWNQYAPYNNLAPTLGTGGNRPPIGCVATAMAQVMNFHKWPLRGKGKMEYHPSYRQGALNYGLQAVDFSQSTYQWDKTNSHSTGTEAQEAVARIMYDAAVSVCMDFTPQASGAYMAKAASSLKDYFDYTTLLVERNNMSSGAYISYIYNELKQGYPVMMTGGTDRNSHAWVCDGVDANGLFSMNWGWGGVSDGYFDLSYLNPLDRGAGGGEGGGYYHNQEIIIVRPNRNGQATLSPTRPGLDFSNEGTMTTSKEQTTRSQGMTLSLNHLGNFVHRQGVKSRVGVALYRSLDEQDPLKTYPFVLSNEDVLLPYGTQLALVQQTITFEADIPDGTYYLYPITKAYELEDVWRKTSKACFLKITIEGDKVSVVERTDKPRLCLLSTPKGYSDGISGRSTSYDITLYNQSSVPFDGTLNILLVKDGKTERIATDDFFRFMDNVQETRHVSFMLPKNLTSGRYEVKFSLASTNTSDGQSIGELMVETSGEPIYMDIQNPSEGPAMQYMTTVVASNNMQINDERVDVDAYPQVQIFVQALNLSDKSYTGKVEYLLENTQTHERISLGELPYSMSGWSDVASSNYILTVELARFNLAYNTPYQLVTLLKSNGKTTHTWVAAQTMTLYSTNGIHGITSDTAPSHVVIYGMDGKYMGSHLDNLPRGVYIVNGRKVIKGR